MLARALVLLLVGFASTAAAQSQNPSVAMVETRPSLAWTAPAGCPDAASLRARVEQRLERSLDDVVIGIEVDIALTAGRYVARIDLRSMTVANDVRTLTSVRCDELADAVAVIVTRVASDAIARKRTAVREDVRAAVIVEPEPAAKPRLWSIGARFSGVSGIGVIPKVGVAAELALVVRRDEFLAEVAGTRWLDSYAQFHDGAPAVVNVALDTAAGRFGWRPAHLPLRAWAAVEFGLMGGNTVKLPTEQLESGRWIAAGAGFGVAWQMTKWIRLVGTNETMLAIDRVRFTTGAGLVVYAPSPMSFRASAGLEVGWE
jgi:hypothetical protein